MNRYLDVLAARRELLAEAAQSFPDDLRSGSSAGAAAALRPFTVESEEADDARAVLVKELARVSSTTVTMTPRSTAEASAERMPTWGRAEYVINVSSLSASAITSCATTPPHRGAFIVRLPPGASPGCGLMSGATDRTLTISGIGPACPQGYSLTVWRSGAVFVK
ncbi:hypothetical protein AB8O38_00485 [Saccharomonospora xinjiangensis]|uniref:hypothetical protein n=1 Tax=Saccharomonospora xinjiangensis TaxID=75294 RepID=UPI00350F90E1